MSKMSHNITIQNAVTKVLDDALAGRKAEVLKARYGLNSQGRPQTLESIGRSYNITRERVRQIEESSYKAVRDLSEFEILTPAIQNMVDFIVQNGGIVTEEYLLSYMPNIQQDTQPYILFLLHISNDIHKLKESQSYKASWASDPAYVTNTKNSLEMLTKHFNAEKSPKSLSELRKVLQKNKVALTNTQLEHILSISKSIDKSPFNKYGLISWSNVFPKTIRDKIEVIFEEQSRPLHFSEIASLIDESTLFNKKRKTHPQTVHNELIKNDQFVLMGRGKYALRKWGYTSGAVKDVIMNILREQGTGMHRDVIVARVQKQREVKKSTILLNLQNKSIFRKDNDNNYHIA